MNSFKFKILGLLSTIAKVLKPYDVSIFVNLYNCLLIVSGSKPFLNSITTLIPSLFDSSLKSRIPSIFLSLTVEQFFRLTKIYLLDRVLIL